jgi:hypothetical protein
MHINKIIMGLVAVCVLFSLARPVYSLTLGVAPSHTDVMFQPNLEKTIELQIFNKEAQKLKVLVYAEGELADYVKINTPTIEFSPGETEKTAKYTVKLPEKIEVPGDHDTKIVIRQIPEAGEAEGTSLSAVLAIVSRLRVTVPYPGKYATARLLAPNFKKDQESNFAVEVVNLGSLDIVKASAAIDIYTPMNAKMKTLVTEDGVPIPTKDKEILTVKWKPDLLGNYMAVATVVYNGHSAKDQKEFSVGEMSLDIASISTGKFSLGGIAKFTILVENNWNEEIPDVYAEVMLKDDSGKTYTLYKTANTPIDSFSKQELEAFLETKGVNKGRYKLDIELNYLGKKTEKVFDIDIGLDKIEIFPSGQTGQIISERPEVGGLSTWVYVLTFLIVIILIMNVFIYFRLIKRRK